MPSRLSLRTTRTSARGPRVHACFRPGKRASARRCRVLARIVPSTRLIGIGWDAWFCREAGVRRWCPRARGLPAGGGSPRRSQAPVGAGRGPGAASVVLGVGPLERVVDHASVSAGRWKASRCRRRAWVSSGGWASMVRTPSFRRVRGSLANEPRSRSRRDRSGRLRVAGGRWSSRATRRGGGSGRAPAAIGSGRCMTRFARPSCRS